ncbi:MAG: hypothetical protein AAGG44_20425, partial [Planctomycetota bacterium]
MSSPNEKQEPTSKTELQDARLDLQLQRAFESVVPPRDLKERITQHLRHNLANEDELGTEDARNVELDTRSTAAHETVSSPAPIVRTSGRTYWIAASVIGVAASLAIAVSIFFSDTIISD